MKYLLVSTILSAALMFYISGGSKGLSSLVPAAPRAPNSESQTEEAKSATTDEAQLGAESGTEPEPEAEQLVQIQGKWHKYRADNRYVIDGIPTFHIAKKRPAIEVRKPASVALNTSGTANGGDGSRDDKNMEKSRRLMKIVSDNPLQVYTPDGFASLKTGLDALKNSNAERKKVLEEISRE